MLDAVEGSASGAAVIGDATLTADLRRLHAISRILLVNAMRHGRLRTRRAGRTCAHRVQPVRPRRPVPHGVGSGLGLAIVRENALGHRGRLGVRNDGAVFTISLSHAA